MAEKHPYYNYYNRAIELGKNGFKLVLGGTGLGKTSGIVDVIKHASTDDRKFIYCANRIQLLNEMAEKLDSSQYVHLRRDVDVVLEAVIGNASHSFNELIEAKQTQVRISRHNQVSHAAMRSATARIQQVYHEIEDKKLAGDMIQSEVRTIMRFFRALISHSHSTGDYDFFTSNFAVQTLFPYIQFKLVPTSKVLLLTIQKAFHGFFDGKQMVTLSNLKDQNGQNIIFLDEFDFLESDLISLICNSFQIDETFKFVEFFYNAMKQHKLPLNDYPISPNIRKRIEEIIQIVDALKDDAKIDFPRINQFTSSIPKNQLAIFQTTHTTSNTTLYLEQTERSFDIVAEAIGKEGNSNLKAIRLFDTIHKASSRILFLFKQLELENPIIFREMLRHCFEATIFKKDIQRVSQLPQVRQNLRTRFDNLLNAGFGLYEIRDLQQETDVLEVTFRHFSVYTTPEKILHSLSANNLVFGLSATADIPRHVRNFNIDWLNRQPDINPFSIDTADREIISKLNSDKQAARNNKVLVTKSSELDKKKNRKLLKHIEAIAKFEEFGGDDKAGHRRRRLERFFTTLHWIIENRSLPELSNDTHLLFFNTFSQIRYLFEKHASTAQNLYSIKKHGNDSLFVVYDLKYEKTDFIVIFYDAAQARSIHSSALAKKQYHQLFWENRPVILVTQYPSAGNGVNLQYIPNPDSENETDFRNIHLLEIPYFFFGRVDPENSSSQNNSIIKQNIWYLAKLFEGKVVSEAWFKSILNNIRKKTLNDDYQKSYGEIADDARLNRLASCIQALGRIERVWSPMPDQTIVLCHEAYVDFQMYCTRAQYAHLREERQVTASNNLRQVFEQITASTQTDERSMRRTKEGRLANVQARCKSKIIELVQQLETVRSGNDITGAKKDWIQLRKTVLEHDFNSEILKRYDCVFKTPYYEGGVLRINRNHEVFPSGTVHSEVATWHLDSIYNQIVENPIIRQYFQSRGYELAFTSVSHQFFTPYCYQAILTGAVGEEAIRAILFHERVSLESISDPLFELADLKIANRGWLIDCKNYSERTLDQFALSGDDPSYRPKLNDNDFKRLAQHKLDRIKKVHPNGKLIFINLLSHNNRPKRYFDREFIPVDSFGAASIIIIQGALNRDEPSIYTPAFEQILPYLQI